MAADVVVVAFPLAGATLSERLGVLAIKLLDEFKVTEVELGEAVNELVEFTAFEVSIELDTALDELNPVLLTASVELAMLVLLTVLKMDDEVEETLAVVLSWLVEADEVN